ncbi:MAG: hypothetical protein M3Y86_01820 [Verrucomicrobiota bacterium]|nr:hypothetical protein [Verrucomicrobiota bacterium]
MRSPLLAPAAGQTNERAAEREHVAPSCFGHDFSAIPIRATPLASAARVLQCKDAASGNDDSDKAEEEKWQKFLKGKELPTARTYTDEKDSPKFIEGLIETSKLLGPYVAGKRAAKSVSKDFHVYGSDPEFESVAKKLVKETPPAGTKIGGFYDRPSDSIHLPPRAPFANALHEGVHKYSAIVLRNVVGSFLNEGVTQYFAERVLAEAGITNDAKNEYGPQLACAKVVVGWLKGGESTLAAAYFQGKAQPVRDELMARLKITDASAFAKLTAGIGAALCERIHPPNE